ncbi:MAG TPA: BatD family protein [Puia sp.]|nr:BatD family protein [Puia sp.]
MVRQWLTIGLALAIGCRAVAQTGCFAQVALDRRSVYVQQPFRVTITVLTPTWYTAPLQFDHLQIPQAFILPFDQTTLGMFTVGGKSYAGLQFYFIVFPYQPGAFVIPPIHIVAHTPPAGSSTSKEVSISTAAQSFAVRPVPTERGDRNWFVAKNVTIGEHWSKPLQGLKVGDVIERTVVIDAGGTLPQFIPPLQKDSLSFADTWLRSADLSDRRDEYDANGRLTQTEIYLLEKEGEFELPAIPVTWWNPISGKLYSRSAAAVGIRVGANPDLGMLVSLKDSLNAGHPTAAAGTAGGKSWRLFGMAWYWAVGACLSGLLLLRLSIGWSVSGWRTYRRRHAEYLAGERYAFRRLMRSPLELQVFIGALYNWWDRYTFPGKSCSVTEQMRQQGYGSIAASLGASFGQLYREGDPAARAGKGIKKEVRAYRKAGHLNC